MIDGMTVKIAVSLPDDLLEHARRMVRDGEATSVSGAVAHALRRHRDTETAEEFLDDLLALSGGPATEEELAAAGRDLGLE